MIFIQNRNIVLASGSPRRKEYLLRYGLKFKILTGNVEETVKQGEDPVCFTERMAVEKANVIIDQCSSHDIIISADTIVLFNDRVLGKPEGAESVFPMLLELNGKSHEVITSYTIIDCENRKNIQRTTRSQVLFNKLPEKVLKAYSKTQDPLDKAGGYSIQGPGTFLVHSINGSYNNVVGLPVEILLMDLLEHKFIAVQD
ncbi:septum formation protein Maf [bacterium]|nr:septum formation protein Maf [bacterium]